MANIYTVPSLATAYADRQLAHQQLAPADRQRLHRRVEYDFKVTGFNAATAAMISFLAIALITNSAFSLVLLAVSYGIRKSFMKAVDLTAAPVEEEAGQAGFNPNFMLRIFNLLPEAQKRAAIAEHLEINEEEWQLNQYQLFDLVIWKNWTPIPGHQGRQEAQADIEPQL